MSKWAGKYVIGLTGNIGTGKSVVRRMLEHLGAYGIDADALAHRAIGKGAPGYEMVLQQFGKWIVGEDGQIDRAKLGRIVFSDPAALKNLEDIVHPLVNQALDFIIRRVKHKVIVVEAIKLFESDLVHVCDRFWVTYAPHDVQLKRLVNKRKMSEADAWQRILNQQPQEEKIKKAHVVIKNIGSVEDTWKMVYAAWNKIGAPAAVTTETPQRKVQSLMGELTVTRGNPSNAQEIAALYNRLSSGGKKMSRVDVVEAFGEKAFLILRTSDKVVGLIGWQVENLVARTTDLIFDPALKLEKAVPLLVDEMERASKELQCEASLMFITPSLASEQKIWIEMGYEHRSPQTLGVMAWQEAARESMPTGSVLFFKQLRTDRILRPILMKLSRNCG